MDKGANHTQLEGDGFMVLKNDLAPTAPKESHDMPVAIEDVLKAVTDLTAVVKAQGEALAPLADLPAKVDEIEKAAKKPLPAFMKPEDDADAKTKAAFDADVTKAIEENPVLKAAFERQAAEIAEAKSIAKGAIDARVKDTFIAKAAADYGNLSIDPETFGPVLKAASESLSPEAFTELERVLKAAAAVDGLATIVKEVGKHGGGSTPTAHDQLTAKAAEIRKSNTGLSSAQAYEAAVEQNPDLVALYAKEA